MTNTRHHPGHDRRFAVGVLQFALLCCVSDAEVIDRIAATIGNRPIMQSQLLEELRVTAFLNGEKPDLSPANRRRTAMRMVEQSLFRREMEFAHFAEPEGAQIEEALKAVKGRFGGAAEFERELKAYGIGAGALGPALERQMALLRFIELRFRPQVQVAETEARKYYETVVVPEYARKRLPPPPFEEARGQCEEALIQQLVDKRVEAWLEEVKGRTRIRYTEEAFQ
jgi:hypothetical protein